MSEEKPKEYKFSLRILIIVLLASALVGGGLIYTGIKVVNSMSYHWQELRNDRGRLSFWDKLDSWFERPTPQEVQLIKVVSEESEAISVVENSSLAVVSIVATAEVPTWENYYYSPFSDLPEEFQQFFNFQVPQRRQNGTEKVRVGAGTGFIVSSDGYIVTNKHVVDDESAEYTVYLNDEENKGEKIKAEVLARDPNNDLAVLKIDKTNLPWLEFGDSQNLKVGQTAITIGYALGEFDNTVSKGVISGLARSITAGGSFSSERLTDLIQTDAAINPGNSGGPMLDIGGKVIGVNVAMASAENIGFAIPGNEAKAAFEEARDTGEIKEAETAFLGVRYMIINEAVRERNNLDYDYGALITRGETREDLAVMPGSPADKAGIQENDIILEVDDEKINERNQLVDLIAEHKPGDKVQLKIYHKGEEREVEVELGRND